MTTVRLFWPRVPGGASQAPSRSFDVAESSSREPRDDVEIKTFITGGYTQPVTSLPLVFITTSILLAK
ncbi:Catalase-peroxidase, partial [Dissostichus eleginoides]